MTIQPHEAHSNWPLYVSRRGASIALDRLDGVSPNPMGEVDCWKASMVCVNGQHHIGTNPSFVTFLGV